MENPPPYSGFIKNSNTEQIQPNNNNSYQPYNITTAFNAYSLPGNYPNTGYNPVYEGNNGCNHNNIVNPYLHSPRVIHLAINDGK
jgi:hypothetical protein